MAGRWSPAVLERRVLMDYDTKKTATDASAAAVARRRVIDSWRCPRNNTIKNATMACAPSSIKLKNWRRSSLRHVLCLDTATGDFKWGLDLQAETTGPSNRFGIRGPVPRKSDNGPGHRRAVRAKNVLMASWTAQPAKVGVESAEPTGWNEVRTLDRPHDAFRQEKCVRLDRSEAWQACRRFRHAGHIAVGNSVGLEGWHLRLRRFPRRRSDLSR